jgi:C4-dicarboxylate-specific signal transduction histidine kinase
LLAFARGQPSQPGDVDVNALLVEAARLLRPTLGDQVEIDSMPATGVALARVDPSRLMTVILNLAIVARDAMPEGGKLVFEIRSCGTEESNACVDGMAAAAEHIVITVSTAGYGSPVERKVGLFADLGMAQDFSERSDGDMSVRRGPLSRFTCPGPPACRRRSQAGLPSRAAMRQF